MTRIRHQLRKLDDTQEEIEKAHERIREKVERQIPEDVRGGNAGYLELRKR